MTSWLNHKALRIMKGIGKYPTDTNSAENNPVVVDLMSGVITLDTDGWSPNIPTVKNGGVWTESPTTDGRSLIAAAAGNVTEKMTLNITDKAYLSVMKALESLGLMASDCRDFWQTQDQIDPVYLMWAAGCNTPPLPQYAILYNIELVPDYLDSPNQPTIRVAMTLEREPYWRGIPPGMNPKMWTFYVNNQAIGLGTKTLADATLITGSDHLITQTVSNKSEWSPTALGLQNTLLSQNYIDIPATLVPGDAPALLELTADDTAAVNLTNLYIGLSKRKVTGVNHAGLLKANSYILAAGDGDVFNGAAKTVGVVGTGELSNNSAVAYHFVRKAMVAGDVNYTFYLSWGDPTSGTILQLDRHFYSGQFAVFLRAKGATDNTTQLARVTFSEVTNTFINGSIVFTDVPIRFDPTVYYPSYVGVISLPLATNESVSLLGYGTQIRETFQQLYISVEMKNSSGANRTVDILDLVLMPMEEYLTQIYSAFELNRLLIDSTGYIQHGRTDPIGLTYAANALVGTSVELRGPAPYLLPKVDQRLYFLMVNTIPGTALNTSQPNDAVTIRLNIVPRWSGIRDV